MTGQVYDAIDVLKEELAAALEREADLRRTLDVLVAEAVVKKPLMGGGYYLTCRFCRFQSDMPRAPGARPLMRHNKDRCPLALLRLVSDGRN